MLVLIRRSEALTQHETIEREHFDMQTIIDTDRYDEVILYDSRSRI